MKLTIKQVRLVIREGIKLYHGSPYRGLKKFTDFRGRIPFIFFTPERGVAIDYSRSNDYTTATFSRHDPGGERESGPTLYVVNVDFPEAEIFDTGRNAEHAKIYNQIQKEVWKLDPEDTPEKLVWTPSVGGVGRIELPSWSQIQKIFPYVAKMGFRAIWFSEGSHGPSLAVRLEDAGSVHIEEVQELDQKPE